MAMKRCPVCGERYNDTYKTCPFCEEEEYWDEELEDTGRRPILREGTRSSGRGGRSAYSVVTPILIVLIILMALLLVYLLYGDKLGGDKDPDEGKVGVQTPVEPDQTPGSTPAADPAGTPDDVQDGGNGDTPDTGMPEGDGTDTPSGGDSSGGMSYAAAAALPGGLTLNNKDFTRKVSEGAYQLKVSGGTGAYTWISENPSVASVSSDGTVTPVASGTTNILVTDGSKKAVCVVRVTGGSAPASGGNTTAPSTTTPSTTTPSTAAPSSGGGSLKAGRAVVINGGNGVRVRSGPGTEHEALATIPNGGTVQIVESAGNDWYKVTFTASGGVTTTGYMKGEFLSNS